MKKTEYDSFIDNLDKMGCPYIISQYKNGTARIGDRSIYYKEHVSVLVAQAYFIFSQKTGKFLMVISDESNQAQRRIKKNG